MKTAYEHNKELIQKNVPSMAYNGEELISWQKNARAKLCELLGMDKFTKVDPEFLSLVCITAGMFSAKHCGISYTFIREGKGKFSGFTDKVIAETFLA